MTHLWSSSPHSRGRHHTAWFKRRLIKIQFHAHSRPNISMLFCPLKDCLLIYSLIRWLISLRSQSLSIWAHCRRNQ
jgi:hypothetical protein